MGKTRELEDALWNALNNRDPENRKIHLKKTLSEIAKEHKKSVDLLVEFPKLKNKMSLPNIVDVLEIKRGKIELDPNEEGNRFHEPYCIRVKTAYTPLMKAIELDDLDCVKALLEAKADVNKECRVNKVDAPPLNIVASQGLEKWVDVLLKAKADVNGKSHSWDKRDFKGKYTALMDAAASGSVHCINSLLKAKANIHAETSFLFFHNGGTALSIATKRGNIECIAALERAKENEHKINRQSKKWF